MTLERGVKSSSVTIPILRITKKHGVLGEVFRNMGAPLRKRKR
jgi:hypothetical protein